MELSRQNASAAAFFRGCLMSLQIFERIVGFFGDAGGAFCDISVLILLLLPLATFAAYFPLLLCIGKVRQTSRVWYLVGGDVCLFLLLALYLCRGDLQDAAPVLALFLCAKVVYLLLYGAVCLVPAQKREKTKKKPRLPAAAEEELFVPPPVSESDPPRPQAAQGNAARCGRPPRSAENGGNAARIPRQNGAFRRRSGRPQRHPRLPFEDDGEVRFIIMQRERGEKAALFLPALVNLPAQIRCLRFRVAVFLYAVLDNFAQGML